KVCIFAFILSRCARRGKQSMNFRVYLVAVRPPRQAKRAFSRLSCRGASAAASKVCIFAVILSRCARGGKQSMNFRVYLVAVRPPRQAKRAFSRLSCRGASAAASKVCIFAFILSRCARRGKQSVNFRVYLVAECSPRQAKCAFSRLSCRGALAAPSKACISRLSCRGALAVASKACIFAFILSRCARRGKQSVHFRVYLVAVRSPWQAKREFSRLSCHGSFVVWSLASHFPVLSSHVY